MDLGVIHLPTPLVNPPVSTSRLVQGSVETIARGHEASVRIAMQGHHAAAAAARLPVSTLSQMLKSALSVELDTRLISQRLMRLIKADRWHVKAEQILRSHAKPTGTMQPRQSGCPLNTSLTGWHN